VAVDGLASPKASSGAIRMSCTRFSPAACSFASIASVSFLSLFRHRRSHAVAPLALSAAVRVPSVSFHFFSFLLLSAVTETAKKKGENCIDPGDFRDFPDQFRDFQ
jgi:hypothetical protein